MDIRTRLWNELIDAKKNEQYLSNYLAKIKRKKQWVKVILICVSVLGISLNQLSQNYSSTITTVIFALIVICEVFKNMIPEIFPDEQLLEKLPEYRMLYVQKFEKLDELWMKYSSDMMSDKEVLKAYFIIRKGNAQIEAFDNSISIPPKAKLMAKAEESLNIYIENHYSDIEEQTPN